MARVTDRKDWAELWNADKASMIETMASNLASDLNAGYDFFGKSIQNQIAYLQSYKAQFDAEKKALMFMTDKEANKWCFADLKKRGAIE